MKREGTASWNQQQVQSGGKGEWASHGESKVNSCGSGIGDRNVRERIQEQYQLLQRTRP